MRSNISRMHHERRHPGGRSAVTLLSLSTLGVLVTLALGGLVMPRTVDAQPPGQVRRIGYLAGGTAGSLTPRLEAFRQGLRELGYAEGQNLTIAYRFAEGQVERLPVLAAELVRLPVEVIVTAGTPGALAAQQATRTIPIVMTNVSDPVARGLIASLARPGGNITGLTSVSTDLAGKRLELLMETVPGLVRVGVLWEPANPGATAVFTATAAAAQAVGVQVHPLEVRVPEEVEQAFTAATAGRVQGLIVVQSPLTTARRHQIVTLATTSRLPTIYAAREFVERGGLMSYGPSYTDLYRRVATYVAKILQGTMPADLPVQTPWKFEFVVNLKSAQALGLTLPPPLLVFADEVIR
jgi:putative ABC transport system substrate-binding protein